MNRPAEADAPGAAVHPAPQRALSWSSAKWTVQSVGLGVFGGAVWVGLLLFAGLSDLWAAGIIALVGAVLSIYASSGKPAPPPVQKRASGDAGAVEPERVKRALARIEEGAEELRLAGLTSLITVDNVPLRLAIDLADYRDDVHLVWAGRHQNGTPYVRATVGSIFLFAGRRDEQAALHAYVEEALAAEAAEDARKLQGAGPW